MSKNTVVAAVAVDDDVAVAVLAEHAAVVLVAAVPVAAERPLEAAAKSLSP